MKKRDNSADVSLNTTVEFCVDGKFAEMGPINVLEEDQPSVEQ